MNAIVTKKSSVFSANNFPGYRSHLRAWLFSWEIYLLVVLTAFLRLYRINSTEFDGDQADIFRMAHEAILHGHLVATSNIASIGIYNPPATVYLLMIPALLSANPLGGVVFTAILAILAVLLTYILTRHFYGRLVGTLAAFFYGTAAVPIFYARFMWNQNLLLFFVPLFIGALFWGVIGRRKGWLGPAIFLLGLLVQLHGSAILLAVPLIVAVFLAPKTLRWRDLLWGCIASIVIYAPYALWFIASNFLDISYLLHTPVTNSTVFDNQSILLYQHFISPFDLPFTNTSSTLYHFQNFFSWLDIVMPVLVIASMLLSLVQIIWAPPPKKERATFLRRLLRWWSALRASPYRCSLILLLLWQILPVIYLLRHTINVQPHYFIILLPGQFILIGLFIKHVIEWLSRPSVPFVSQVRYAFYALAVLIIATQFVASTGLVIDGSRGVSALYIHAYPYHSDLNSLQSAVNEADHLAQQKHYSRLYISTDLSTREALRFLGTQTRTPSTVFDDNCVILPGPASGPAVLLVAPNSEQANVLVTRFSHTTLVATPRHLGGNPFRLYVVSTPDQPVARVMLSNELQFVNSQAFNDNNTTSIVARWELLRSEQPNDRTLYSYSMRAVDQSGAGTICIFTAMRAGDQVLSPLQPPATGQHQLNLQVASHSFVPYYISLGFITFDTYRLIARPWKTLSAPNGRNVLLIPIT